MARQDRVAARYAKAVFELVGSDQQKARAALKELEQVARLASKHADLGKVFGTELFPSAKRRAVVEDLAVKLKLSELVTRTLIVLSDARRLSVLDAVVEKLKLLLLEAAGVIPLKVEAATDLSEDERDRIEKKFSQILGKKVEASYVVEPAVVGGLRVMANGKTYDGTVSGWLSAIREQLAEGSI